MTLLVLGASGFVGNAFVRQKLPGEIYTSRRVVSNKYVSFNPLIDDLRSISGIANISHALLLFGEREPDHCAIDPVGTRKVNVEAPCRIIAQCTELGITPIFVSTEMVFDGDIGMYAESDVPMPILEYGRQKLATEQYLLSKNASGLVLRLPKTIGLHRDDRSLFTNWLREIAQHPKLLQCAIDQFFSLQLVDEVPEVVRALVRKSASGILHLGDGQRHSRFDLLSKLCSKLQKFGFYVPKLEEISIRDLRLPEPRPMDVSMDTTNLRALVGIEPERVDCFISIVAKEYAGS